MYMTSSSLSYFFLAITVLSIIFSFYFKVIVLNTSEGNSHRGKIIGKMKDPDAWRDKNNIMSYIFLFWSIISLGIFIYLKYYYGTGLVSLIYVIAYLILMVVSIAIAGAKRKSRT